MWVVYKKSKTNCSIKQLICKRNRAICDRAICDRAICDRAICDKKYEYNSVKKQKFTFCLVHEEEYICDIYGCSGIKKICYHNNIPYII